MQVFNKLFAEPGATHPKLLYHNHTAVCHLGRCYSACSLLSYNPHHTPIPRVCRCGDCCCSVQTVGHRCAEKHTYQIRNTAELVSWCWGARATPVYRYIVYTGVRQQQSSSYRSRTFKSLVLESRTLPVKSSNLMKPKPLGCPVYLSFMSAMSASVPYFPK